MPEKSPNGERAEPEPGAIGAARRRKPPWWRSVLVAALCVLAAFGIRYWLTPVLGDELPFLLFIAAALVAAWYGGAATGVAALLLGLFLAEDFFVEPKGIPYPVELFDFIRYVFTAALGVGLIEVLRRGRRQTEIALDQLQSQIERRRRTEAELREARDRISRHAAELERRVSERTAELTATVDSLRDLLYHIAHNLRAPLRAMEGYATLLERDCPGLDAAARGYSRRISEAARRMDDLIQDLLEYGRLGHAQLELRPVSLQKAAEAALRELSDRIESKQAQVAIAGPLPNVVANPPMLRRVLLALLENALKFVPPDVAPRVRLRAEPRGPAVRLWIEDNGVGIEPKYQERIFGAFERLETSEEGTGIGLAIVKQAMQRMGGQVGVESQPGNGSRFWLEFQPAAGPADEEPEALVAGAVLRPMPMP